MKRTLLITGDGSSTLHIEEWNEQYHSKHGAIAEALHVFIKEGFQYFYQSTGANAFSILEMGFGTGLNAFLTLQEAEKYQKKIDYTTLEAYPLKLQEIEQLNYASLLNSPKEEMLKLHQLEWEVQHVITPHFNFTKHQMFFAECDFENAFDLIYFDAFGIRVQPELWTEAIFATLYRALKPNGLLVTYAANGAARRAMMAQGFDVKRLPGPPGKKEMMRAQKN